MVYHNHLKFFILFVGNWVNGKSFGEVHLLEFSCFLLQDDSKANVTLTLHWYLLLNLLFKNVFYWFLSNCYQYKGMFKKKFHKRNSKSEVPNWNLYLLQYANEILVVTAAMLTIECILTMQLWYDDNEWKELSFLK